MKQRIKYYWFMARLFAPLLVRPSFWKKLGAFLAVEATHLVVSNAKHIAGISFFLVVLALI